jgi:hypothetical protein
MVQMRPNTARPDILAADEPQPVEPLFIGQADAVAAFAHAHAAPPIAAAPGLPTGRPRTIRIIFLPPAFALGAQGSATGADRPILDSVPARRRTILGRCMIHNRMVRSTKTIAVRGSSMNHKATGVAALAARPASEE